MDLESGPQRSALSAIRIFTVHAETGAPVPGVPLTLFASGPAGDRRFGSVVSDAMGYAKFALRGVALTAAERVIVSHGPAGDRLVVDMADLGAGRDVYTVAVDPATARALPAQLGVPAVMDPDLRDLELSPGSIGLTPHLTPENGLCGQLTPTVMAVRRYPAFHVRADICNPTTLDCPAEGPMRIVYGKILEYEIAWYPVGVSLGELLNTQTLAPGERITLAVSDWVRREIASRQQSSLTQQEEVQQIDLDRQIVETLESTTKSKSLAAGVAGSIGVSVPIKGVNLGAAYGGGVGGSLTTTQLAVATTRRVSEHISQTATLVASERSTVVFQATASERSVYQTRTVCNPNCCHTLTLAYYQVNRSYEVVTEFKGERDVILVEYPNDDFDAKRAFCQASVLRPALLDPTLAESFDLLGDALFCCDQPAAGAKVRMTEVTVRATVHSNHFALIDLTLRTNNSSISLPGVNILSWSPGGTYQATVPTPPLDPADITHIFANLIGGGGSSNPFVADLTLTYEADGFTGPFTLWPLHTQHSMKAVSILEVHADLPPQQTGPENACVASSCGIQKLLAHLNCPGNKRYYNTLMWLREDPDERVTNWSCCKSGGAPFSLFELIENQPIAVFGNFLVFPAAGSQLVDDPLVPDVRTMVVLPTPGVYSEGILGQCDTCEVVDRERHREWSDSPCACASPDTTEPPTPQGGVRPEDLKPDAVSNLINLSTVPTLPDSLLKALVESLASKAAEGNDKATALLEKLIDLVKATLPKPAAPPESASDKK